MILLRKKSFFLVSYLLFGWAAWLHSDTPWTATSGTVPNDGVVYYIENNQIDLTGNFYIEGMLELRSSGTLDTNGQAVMVFKGNTSPGTGTNNHYITVKNGGSLIVDGTSALSRVHIGYSGGRTLLGKGILNIETGGIVEVISSGDDFGEIYTGWSHGGEINMFGGVLKISTNGRIYNGWREDGLTGILNIYGGSLVMTAGQFRNSAAAVGDYGNGAVRLSGGSFSQSGGIFYNGYGGSSDFVGDLTISGTGVYNYTGGNFYNGYGESATGNINVSGGTLNIAATPFFNAYGLNTTGNINISSGALNLNSGGYIRNTGINGSVAHTGYVTLSGTGILNHNGGTFYNGNSSNQQAYLNINGGEYRLISGSMRNGERATGNLTINGGEFIMSGGEFRQATRDENATLTLSSGEFRMLAGTFYNGYASGLTSNVNINGGIARFWGGTVQNGRVSGAIGNFTVNAGEFVLGSVTMNSGSGTSSRTIFGASIANFTSGAMAIPGGQTMTLDSGETFFVGVGGNLTNNGNLYIDGTFSTSGAVTNNSVINNGNGASSTGIINVFDGTFSHESGAGNFYNGSGSGATGYIRLYGGTFAQAATIRSGQGANSTGELRIRGGEYNLSGILYNSGYSGGTGIGTIVIEGGTFKGLAGCALASGRYAGAQVNVWGGEFLWEGGDFSNGLWGTSSLNIGSGICVFSGGEIRNGSKAGSAPAADGIITVTGGELVMLGGNWYNAYNNASAKMALSGGKFSLLGGTISNGYDSSEVGDIDIVDGEFLLGNGTLTKGSGTSNVNIFGANLDGIATPINSGLLTIPSAQVMDVTPGNTFFVGVDGGLTNNGTIYVDGILTNSGSLINSSLLTNSGLLTNLATFSNSQNFLNDGMFTNSDIGTFENYLTFTNAELFENYGLFTNDALVLNAGELENKPSGTVDNNSTFTVTNLLTNDGFLLNDGYLWINHNGVIDNNGTFTNNSIVNNRGDFLADGITRGFWPWVWRSNGGVFENNGVVYDWWDPTTDGYTIPDNDRMYYLDYSISLTQDLQINGSFAVWAGGELYTSNYTISLDLFLTISQDGLLTINDGMLTNSGLFDNRGTVSNDGFFSNNEICVNYGSFYSFDYFDNNDIFVNRGQFFNFGVLNEDGRSYEPWTPQADSYIIPIHPHGFFNFLETEITLTQDLIINGSFAIWGDGVLNTDRYKIWNNNNLTFTGGMLNHEAPGIFINGNESSGRIVVEDGQYNLLGGFLYNGYNYTGTIDIIGGTFNLWGGALQNGPLAQGDINLLGGDFDQGGGILQNALMSAGNLVIVDGTYSLTGGLLKNGYGVTGEVAVVGGVLDLQSAGIFYNGYASTGNLTVDGGTLRLTSGSHINGDGTQQIGNLDVVSGVFVMENGAVSVGGGTNNINIFGAVPTLDTAGIFTISSGQTMDVPAGSSFYNDSFLVNDGTLTVSGLLDNNGTFTNNYILTTGLTGTIINDERLINENLFENYGLFENNNLFINNGIFRDFGTTSGGGVNFTYWDPSQDGYVIPLSPWGTVYVIDEYVELQADLLINGTLVIWEGGTLDTNGYNVSIEGSLTVSGCELIIDPGSELHNESVLHVSVGCAQNYGELLNDGLFDNDGTFTNYEVFVNNGTFRNDGEFYNLGEFFNNGEFVGGFSGAPGLYYTGWGPGDTYIIHDDGLLYYLNTTFTLTDDLLISGSLIILSGGELYTGTYSLTNDLSLTISGGLLWINQDGGRLLNNGTLTNSGVLNNFYTFTNAGIFDNNGTFLNEHSFTNSNVVIENVDMSGTGTWYEQWEVGDEGYTIPRDGRVYYLDYPVTLGAHLTNNGIFEVWAGGNLDNAGSYHVQNNNTVNVTGTLTISNGSGEFRNAFDASSTATVRINSGGFLETYENFFNGYGSNSNGSLYVNEGGVFVQFAEQLRNPQFGSGGKGYLFVNGGTVGFDGGTCRSGELSGDVGYITLNSGLILVTLGGFVNVNQGSGSFVINGGTFRQTAGNFFNSSTSVGLLVINAGGRLEYAAADDSFGNGLASGGVGIIRVNTGGTLALFAGEILNGNSSGAQGFIIISGGTLDLQNGQMTHGKNAGAQGYLTAQSGTIKFGDVDISVGDGSGATYLFTDTIQSVTNGYLHILSNENVSIPYDSSIVIESVSTLTNDGVLTNTGSLTNTGTIDNNNIFTNNNLFTNDGYFVNDGIFTNTGVFDNNETFENNNLFVNRRIFTNTSPFINNGLYYDLWQPDLDGYTIPDDGAIYFVDDDVALGADLTIDGTFMIWTGATLDTNGYTISNDGMLTISCGTLLIDGYSILDNKLDGTVTLSCGTIINNGQFFNDGTFIITNGTLQNNQVFEEWDFATDGYTIPSGSVWYFVDYVQTLDQDLTINGTLVIWSGGELNTNGHEIYNNNTLTVSGGQVHIDAVGGMLNGYNADGFINLLTGTLQIHPYGTLYSGSGGVGRINISGGTLAQGGGTLANGYDNTGIISITDGLLTLTDGDFYNGDGGVGTIDVTGGTLDQAGVLFYNGWGSDGGVTIDGGTLRLTSGTITNGYGAGLTGDIIVSSGTLVLDNADIYDSNGTSNVAFFGFLITDDLVDSNLTIFFDQVFMLSSGQTLELASNGVLLNNGILLLAGGTFVDNGTFTNNGFYFDRWEPNETYIIPPDDVDGLRYYMDFAKTLTADLLVDGTFDIWSTGTLITDGYTMSNDGLVTLSCGTLFVSSGGLFYNMLDGVLNTSCGNFYNFGTFINNGEFIGDFAGDPGLFYAEWMPEVSYVIPDDGFPYYLTTSFTLTDDLLVSGSFVIWTDGELYTSTYLVTNDLLFTISGALLWLNKEGGRLINNGTLTNSGVLNNFYSFTNAGILDNNGTFLNELSFTNSNIVIENVAISGAGTWYEQWEGAQNGYTIPNDGRIYFVDYDVVVDANLTNNGVFEIWPDGEVGSLQTITNNCMFWVKDGIFTNSGLFENNSLLTNNGIVTNGLTGTFINDWILENNVLVENYGTFTNNVLFINNGIFRDFGITYNNGAIAAEWVPSRDGYIVPARSDGLHHFINEYITLGADLTINGSLIIWTEGTLDTDGYTISNNGILTTSCGNLIISVGSIFDNNLDGTVTISCGTLINNGDIYNNGTFIVDGIFQNNGFWYTPWNPNETYPIPDDGFSYYLNYSFTLTADLLVSGSLVIFENGEFYTDAYTLSVDGAMTLSGGTFVIDGLFDDAGFFTNNNGSVTNNGIWYERWDATKDSGYVLSLFDDIHIYYVGSSVALGQDMTINGTLEFWPGGTLRTNGYNICNNKRIEIDGGTLLVNGGELRNGCVSTGEIIILDGTLDVQGSELHNGYGLNVPGRIIIDGGMLCHRSGVFYVSNYGPGTVTVYDGTLSIEDPGYVISGNWRDGVIDIWGGTVEVGGQFTNGLRRNGTINLGDGFLNIVDGGDLRNGALNLGGPIDYEGVITQTGGIFRLLGGTITNSWNVDFDGRIFVQQGEFVLGGGSLVNGDGGHTYLFTDSIQSVTNGYLNILPGELFSIPFGSTFVIDSLGTVTNDGLMINKGSFRITGTFDNSGTFSNDALLTNNGLFVNNAFFKNYDVFANNETFSNDGFVDNYGTFTNMSVGFLDNNGTFSNFELMVNDGEMVNDGTFCNHDIFINSGLLTNNGYMCNDATIINHTTGVFTNNYFFVLFGDGEFINNGIFNGSLLDLRTEPVIIPEGEPVYIHHDFDWNILEGEKVIVLGEMINRSNNSINVYGGLYNYGTIANGDSLQPGIINVYHPGLFAMLSGTLQSQNDSSVVNVFSGGSLYNYYGTVDISQGDVHLRKGGQFDNAGCNAPESFTADNGSIFTDGSIVMLDRDFDIDATWTITHDAVIHGCDHKLVFGQDGEIVVGSGRSVRFENITIDNLSGNKIRCMDETATLSLANVIWIQDGNFSFTLGTIDVVDDWYLIGDENNYFSYQSANTLEVARESTIHVTKDMVFEIGLIGFHDSTARINLHGSTLQVAGPGTKLTFGTLRVANDSILAVDTTYGVTFGDDFSLEIEGGARLTIQDGTLFYNNNASQDGIKFIKDSAIINISQENGLTAVCDLTLRNGVLYTPITNPLATLGASQVTYDKFSYVYDDLSRAHDSYVSYFVTGTFKTANGYLAIDNGLLEVRAGRLLTPLRMIGASKLFGSGVAGNTITLQDKTATLDISLDSDIHGDIALNGGTLNLGTHVRFANDKTITGSGAVVLNSHKFSFGTTNQSNNHDIYWDMSSQVELQANMILSGTWTFSGTGRLSGNGHILDLTNSGRLIVDNDATLYLTDIIIKGLGENYGDLVFMNDNAQVIMANVGVVLANNYTVTIGGMYVEGPTHWFVDRYNWRFDVNASLTIDGTTLWRDSLDEVSLGDIVFGTPQENYLSLLNSGTIKVAAHGDWLQSDTTKLGERVADAQGDISLLYSFINSIDHGPDNVFFDSNQTLSYNIYLGPHHKMYLQNDLRLNGSTWYIYFSRADEPLFLIDSGITVTLEHIVLKDFLPEYVSFGDEQSELVFGDGVTIELAHDMMLSRQWLFVGDCVIKGFGNRVMVADDGLLDVAQDSVLTIDRVVLDGFGVRCRTNDGVVVLKDSEVVLASDYTFSSGAIRIERDVKMTGTNTFVYASAMTSTIDSSSMLYLDYGVTFSYDSPTENRELLVMTDTTSKLYLDGCMLYSTPTGLRLTTGRVLFDNYVTLSADGQQLSEAISFDDTIIVDVLAGAYVEVYGYIDIA